MHRPGPLARRPPVLVLFLPLLIPFLATSLSAQSIRGRLLDADTERPVASATVTLLGSGGRVVQGVLTDSAGAFELRPPTGGRYRLRGERIGYRASESPPLDLQRGDTLAVVLHLSTEAVLLAPLTVTASPRQTIRDRNLDGFYRRQTQGWGRFYSPGDIERLGPATVSSLLQMTPGVNLRYGRSALRPVVTVRSGMRECVPTLYVDGRRVPLDAHTGIDDWTSGSSLRALEIYRSPIEAPGEFLTQNDCGVILIWTEFGIDP